VHEVKPGAIDSPVAKPLDDDLARNDALVTSIMSEYHKRFTGRKHELPAMLTEGDRALYYHIARNHQFNGSVVDAGCFVGGTTMSLVRGLQDNPLWVEHEEATQNLIRVYDLFEINEEYILGHLKEKYPDREFTMGGTFEHVFRANLGECESLLDVRSAQPIEVLGVDLCKAINITDSVVREFFPRLLPQAFIIQQDFIHEFHPHIHLSMMRLADHFERYAEIHWGGSVAFRCVKPITPEIIIERFGEDASWYEQVDRNVEMLRDLESKMLYDGNRWIILLTLGIYYYQMGRQDDAKTTYHEACRRFPQYEPNATTRELIGEEAVAL